MKIDDLAIVYFIVFFIMLIGSTLFYRRKSPEFKKKWHVPVTLVNLIVIGGFLFAFAIMLVDSLIHIIPFVLMFIFILYISIFKTKVCGACGKTNQPENLITAPEFCSKCGEKLSQSKFFGV
ncbi:MAG: hypothetical protein SWH61_15685 [Thermodesulfobacteriota bacterium]|nr:hypothetical protein [Thermodesulfobacteriota bacterium]